MEQIRPVQIVTPHASPALQKYARELGVDLTLIKGRGSKGRILKEDVNNRVKQLVALAAGKPPAEVAETPSTPVIDFSKFGDTEIGRLSRIKRVSSSHLHRAWMSIPHVTNHDEVDMDDGLVIPVIRGVERKNIFDLGAELVKVSERARSGKLRLKDFEGGCISISSLGRISGTGFTPIINSPEVAILGLSRTQIKPWWNDMEFEPRIILSISLSYDHCVIDGAEAARYLVFLKGLLNDWRRILILSTCAPRGAVLLAAESASSGSGNPPQPVSSLGPVWVTNPVKRRQRGDRP